MYKPGNEAEKIYLSIFNTGIPESVKTRFNDVSDIIENNFLPDEVRKYYDLVHEARDLEAIELAARYLKKMPILTEKFKVMVYLAETVPQNYDVFINETPRQATSYAAVAIAAVRTILKMSKGFIMLLRYRL